MRKVSWYITEPVGRCHRKTMKRKNQKLSVIYVSQKPNYFQEPGYQEIPPNVVCSKSFQMMYIPKTLVISETSQGNFFQLLSSSVFSVSVEVSEISPTNFIGTDKLSTRKLGTALNIFCGYLKIFKHQNLPFFENFKPYSRRRLGLFWARSPLSQFHKGAKLWIKA